MTEVDYHQHSAGIFEIADLPHYSSTLLLVISRHDIQSNAVNFESHVFRNSENAQVAVVDTFKGRNKARIQIMDAHGEVGTHGEPEGYNPIPGDKSYNEDLIVFPLSDANRLKGAATRGRGDAVLTSAALMAT